MDYPRTSIPEIQWPALPDAGAASLLAVQYQLNHSQWLSSEELFCEQYRQLSQLVNHAFHTTSYYRQKLTSIGWGANNPLTRELWEQIPILTRSELQEHGDSLQSTQAPPQHGKLHEIRSSGSTGKPVRVLQSALNSFFWQVFTMREHLWQQRNLKGKLAAIRFTANKKAKPPHGIRGSGWGPSTNRIFETGPMVMLSISTSIQEQADWLIRENPDYLLTHPTNALALARHFEKTGETLPGLRQVRALGETINPELHAICRGVWGVSLADMYSAQEVGYIALQCPDHLHYHIQSESVLVEVLDKENQPCAPGETGRVVVTPLHNFAMPLLRYELGDYAEMGGACPCGRGLPVLTKILGRVRNMVTLPSGEQHWPDVAHRHYRKIAPIKQMQIVQHTPETIEVRLVVETSLTPEQEGRLILAIRDSLKFPFQVSFTYAEHIPRSKGGKFEEFVSEVAQNAQVAL